MTRLDSRARILATVGATIWIFNTLQYGAAQLVVAAAWHTGYSWSGNYISDLGNTRCAPFAVHGTPTYVCSPLHALMNGSFVLSGVLTLAGTILLWRVWPSRTLTTAALGLWLAAGVLKIVVGLAPENANAGLHLLGAANLPIQSAGIVLLGVSLWPSQHALAPISMVVGGVGLVGAVLTSLAQTTSSAFDLGLGNGGMERVAGYPGSIWMALVGLAVLHAARSPRSRAGRRRPLAAIPRSAQSS
jgi:hypothetical membrane protein